MNYSDFTKVFLTYVANWLLANENQDPTLEISGTSFFNPLYNLSQKELEIRHDYIWDNLAKKFIQLSFSLSNALILLIKKRNSIL